MKLTKGLTGFQLKYIALILMVFDHIHYFFDYTGKIPLWFSQLGRLSAPLFLFCVIEGFIHTRNRKRYFLQMYGLAAVMGAIQFGFYNVLSSAVRPDGFFPKNMMLSSFVILLVALQGLAWIEEKKYGKGILTVLFPILLPFLMLPFYTMTAQHPLLNFLLNLLNFTLLPLHTAIQDGGTMTLIIGIAMYLGRKTLKREVLAFVLATLVMNGLIFFLAGVRPSLHTLFFQDYEWLAIFAAPIMLAYNGKRGSGSKSLFYVFYPTHIYVLYILSLFLYSH